MTSTEDNSPSSATSERSLGLDVLRGAVMIGLAVLVFTPWTAWRGHAVWWGWRPSDVFFPLFLTVAGAGLALQTKRGIPWVRVVRRFVALVFLGLLMNALLGQGLDVSVLRVTGILQRIAIAGLAGAIVLAMVGRRWWTVSLAALGFAVAWGVVILVAAAGCPQGQPTPAGCGTLHGVDQAAFGRSHVYAGGTTGHDPEGLVSSLGATASLLAGTGAALLIGKSGAKATRRARNLGLLATAWLVAGVPLLGFAPFGKRMWTPAFVAFNAAGAIAALAILVILFDSGIRHRAVARMRSAAVWPVVAVGRNALLSWSSLFVIDHALDVTQVGGRPLEEAWIASMGRWTYFAVMLGGWMAVWCAMHAARWHVRL